MGIVEESASVPSGKVGQGTRRQVRTLSDFGRYIKERGLTVPDVATALGLSRQYVYMWARGACRPGWKVARRIEAWTTEKFGPDGAFVVDRWVA